MLKGQDIVVLLKLLGVDRGPPVRELAGQLGFDLAGTHRAIRRLEEAGLYSGSRQRVVPAAAEEFLVHAVKFSFPAEKGTEGRGVPTSWGAAPLSEAIAGVEGLRPIWPYSLGETRGLAIEPLHPMVPKAALADRDLWERLALVDALRSDEGARVTQIAADLLLERIGP